MPDLAKVSTRAPARRRGTTNRDFTLPSRRNVDAPSLEVNAPITRPRDDGAEELRRTLGLITDTALTFAGDAKDRRDRREAGDGAYDGSINNPDDERFAKSRAYRRAYQIEAAKRGAFQLDLEVTEAVQNRLADDTDPATLGDVEQIIEQAFTRFGTDPETGKVRDFGDAQAALAVAQQLGETRKRLMSNSYAVIKERQNEETLSLIAGNAIKELMQGPVAPLEGAPANLANLSAPPEPAKAAAALATSKPALTGLPLDGAVTSRYGARGLSTHNGVDIDGKIGDPVVIRAGGTVIQSGSNKSSGNFIIVDHGNGVQTSYSHLSKRNFKKGDQIAAGDTVGLVGNTGNVSRRTGDGSHLHYVIRVDGKTVDPTTFVFPPSRSAAAPPPNLTPAPDAQTQEAAPPPLAFESVMARVPETVARADAKKYLLQTFLTAASEQNHPEWLDALARSERKDGTPSFNPAEVKLIYDERDKIRDRMRVEAKRARDDRYEANEEILMSSMAQDRPPGIETIKQWEREDRISGRFASALKDHIEADERRVEAEARQEAREAARDTRDEQARVDNELDVEWAGEAEIRRSGVLNDAEYDDDQLRLQRGDFGTGKRAVARYKMLRSAARAGQAARLAQPEAAIYVEKIVREYTPSKTGSSRVGTAVNGGTAKPTNYAVPILADFRKRIGQGEEPSAAYAAAVAAFGPKPQAKDDPKAARDARIKELRKKRDGR